MRLSALSADSAWSWAIWPADPKTGERSRAAQIQVIDDPAAIDAYFARQGEGD